MAAVFWPSSRKLHAQGGLGKHEQQIKGPNRGKRANVFWSNDCREYADPEQHEIEADLKVSCLLILQSQIAGGLSLNRTHTTTRVLHVCMHVVMGHSAV